MGVMSRKPRLSVVVPVALLVGVTTSCGAESSMVDVASDDAPAAFGSEIGHNEPALPEDPFASDCVEPTVHDPVAGYCVASQGEDLNPQDGSFRTRHPWLQEAQADGETIRYVIPGFAPGGHGGPEHPLGSWSGATDNLPPGSNVTYVVGRGRVDGRLELDGMGRVTIIGNAAAVTRLRSDNEAAIVADELTGLRVWGLAIERLGDVPGPAVEIRDTGAVSMGQLRLLKSSGGGILSQRSGEAGFMLTNSSFLDIAGDGLRSTDALGWWTVDGAEFRGPIGSDGISVVDFGGSQFRVGNSAFHNVGSDGISVVDFGGSQFRVSDSDFDNIGSDGIAVVDFGGSQFLVDNGGFSSVGADGISVVDFGGSQFRVMASSFEGPIGGDGISIVDFGGSQFRSHQNHFASIDGSGISSRGGGGDFAIEESQMEGPIGRDGVTIQGFSGERAHIGTIELGSVGRIGISVRDALGWWTVDGATFRGPVGFDGLQFIGVGEAGKRVKLTNLEGDGISRVGMRLLDGLGWWTLDGVDFRGTSQMAVQASGFEATAALDLHRIHVTGATGIGVMLDSTAATVEMTDSEINETAGHAHGGDHQAGPTLGYGLLAKDVGKLRLANSSFRGNEGTAIVIDLSGWGARRERQDLQGTVRVELENVVVEGEDGDPAVGPQTRTQNLTPDTEIWVDGDRQQGLQEDGAEDAPLPEQELRTPGCGDGVVDDLVEQCDDGNESDYDACTTECRLNICGDGLHHEGVEECDDGNDVQHGDGCNNDCEEEDRVVIPGGQFVFGNTSNAANGVRTSIDTFSMNRHEVTCEQFSDYWSNSGSTQLVLSDGADGAGDHSWYMDPHEGVVPRDWPFVAFDANDPPEYVAATFPTPATEAFFPQANVVEGEGERWQTYYLFRRFRHDHQITGGFIDIHHPGAAIRVYLAGRLIHQAGWPQDGVDSPLVPEATSGTSRILLKDEAIAHHNQHSSDWKYIAIALRPFPAGTGYDSLAFALTYKVWNQIFQTARKPWFNNRGEHIRTGHGQLLCGEPHWPVAMDWHKARDYCRWHGGDLPTEAQWEYAARNLGQNVHYPWGNLPRITASYSGGQVACEYAHSSADTAPENCPDSGIKLPVCSRPLGNTQQGLCDMIGNMWEWTLDGFTEGHGDDLDNNGDGRIDERGELLVPSASGPSLTGRPLFWSNRSEYVVRGGSSANTIGAYTTGRMGRTATWFLSQDSIDFGFRCAWPVE